MVLPNNGRKQKKLAGLLRCGYFLNASLDLVILGLSGYAERLEKGLKDSPSLLFYCNVVGQDNYFAVSLWVQINAMSLCLVSSLHVMRPPRLNSLR